jgi:hypothetical protein
LATGRQQKGEDRCEHVSSGAGALLGGDVDQVVTRSKKVEILNLSQEGVVTSADRPGLKLRQGGDVVARQT